MRVFSTWNNGRLGPRSGYLERVEVAEKKVSRWDLGLFFRLYPQEIRFTLRFLVILAGLNYAWYLLTNTVIEQFILNVLTAKPPMLLINLLTPDERVVLTGNQLLSKHVTFRIVNGCEGMGGIVLIISAVCAVQVGLERKLKGLCYGVMFIYLLNTLRIVALYYVMRYYPGGFSFFHIFVGQSVAIFLGCAFFVVWISRNTAGNGQRLPG